MTVYECHYCGDTVYDDEIGYNFFEDKYYCNPDCAKKDGVIIKE